MSYKAYVVKPDSIVPIPGADKIQELKYNGTSFIVDLSIKESDLVLLFLSDGKLSHEFASNNNLYKHNDLNKNKEKCGYLEDNGKVRAIKLKGVMSYGIVMPLSSLDYIPGNKELIQGMEFDTINGHVICEKVITIATAKQAEKLGIKGNKKKVIELVEHYDTQNILKLSSVPSGQVIITEKLHGTSGRTGKVKVTQPKKFLFFFKKQVTSWECVSGTRHTILTEKLEGEKEYYRWAIHKQIEKICRTGETFYYEIVGRDSTNSPIMIPQDTRKMKDKSISEKFGPQIIYSYGADTFDFYVYRITQLDPEGNLIELCWDQIEARCKQVGFKVVPVLDRIYEKEIKKEDLMILVESYVNGLTSTLANHLREGVVVRFENSSGISCFKKKTFPFMVLEGIAKEQEDQVDVEESN